MLGKVGVGRENIRDVVVNQLINIGVLITTPQARPKM